MMCFRGPLICYALVTPDVLLVTQTLYFSQFFTHFFVGLGRICLCASLLFSIQSPEYWKLHFRALKFQNFLGEQAPRPSQKKGTIGPLSTQSVTLFKPAGYFNIIETPCKHTCTCMHCLFWRCDIYNTCCFHMY